jgi:dienelactone hydrolase
MNRWLPVLWTVVFNVAVLAPGVAQERWPFDEWLTRPVNNATFETYRQFFTYDRSTPLDLRVLNTGDEDGLRREHLSFQGTPGQRVFANYYPAVRSEGALQAAVILLHGGSAEGKDSPGAKRIATFLVRGGFSVLAIDLPYFGERGGDLLTTYTEQEKHERLYNQPPLFLAWVTQLTKDVGRAFDLLVTERGATPRHVGLVGYSRGAQVGTIVAAVEQRFAAAALLYGGHFDRGEKAHLPAACPANYIGRIAPRPLLMVNGTLDDDYSRERSVEPLYRLAKQPKTILWAETGHQVPSPEQLSAAVQFLRTHLE